ncbi:MAG TPA: hypothetical protein VGN09_19045 [Vicinamibacteria bacterium]
MTRDDWTPVPISRPDPESLRLTPVEAYVLSRIDGVTSVGQLALISGMAPQSLQPILERLVREGAIEAPPPARDVPGEAAPHAAGEAATHRQLFETRLHPLGEDERERLASTAGEPELSALCFDPTPRVVRAALENPRAGLPHARLIAAHHGNAVGLEALGEKAVLLQDAEVQRLLLRNQQTPAPLLQRLLSRRRLAEVYQTTQSRELPERNRRSAVEALRRRFAETTSEERVELILRTEGRALAALAGLSVDGKAAALLCARTLTSLVLLENLARWPATPPAVIAHLLKQPMVLRMPQVRTLLKRHPNCPASER